MYVLSLDMLNNFNGKEFRLERAITSCTPMFDLVTNKYIARSRSSSHLSLLINTLTFGHSRSFDQLTPIQLRVNPQTGKVVQSLLITSISISVSWSIHLVIETKNSIFFFKQSPVRYTPHSVLRCVTDPCTDNGTIQARIIEGHFLCCCLLYSIRILLKTLVWEVFVELLILVSLWVS